MKGHLFDMAPFSFQGTFIIKKEYTMSQKEPFMYTANDLYDWLTDQPDFLLLDVRNEKDFSNFAVEGPECIPYINIPYFDFIEDVPG